MTREQAAELGKMYARRDVLLMRFKELKADKRESIGAQITVNGCTYNVAVSKPYITAQWTAELLDVERRIRAAGGTL